MPCLVSSFWLNSFCITGSRLIHITTTDSNLFLFTDDWYSFVFMYHSLFIHLSAHEHLGYFHFLYRPQFGSVQLLSHVWLFVTPWTAACQACLSITELPESTQNHVPYVGDAIQPSHPLSSPSPPALNLSQHQGLFTWVSSSHHVAKVLEFQLQHQSLQWTLRTDLL